MIDTMSACFLRNAMEIYRKHTTRSTRDMLQAFVDFLYFASDTINYETWVKLSKVIVDIFNNGVEFN